MGGNGKANIEENAYGFVKTFFEKDSLKIKGAVLMCERATDMIGELALAVNCRLTASDIASTIHPHPTVSEAIRITPRSLKKIRDIADKQL
jgi:dihydrolipoamide dehydrogenase